VIRRGKRTIVTPEHVEVRLTPAGLGSRFIALLVDAALTLSASGLLSILLVPTLPEGLGYALWATASFVLTWGYHVFFEVFRNGRSPGKALVGLRVVDGRGLALSVGQSFVRNVLRVLDFAPAFYGLGALVIQLDPHRRRLGDLAADTMVVAEGRSPLSQAERALMRGFDSLRSPQIVRRIRHRVGVEERELLTTLCVRSEGLEPRARFDLFDEVARHYGDKLEISEETLSGENLVRGLVAVLTEDRRARRRS
jgi:uncharacterized RDD family membrane protein YckC